MKRNAEKVEKTKEPRQGLVEVRDLVKHYLMPRGLFRRRFDRVRAVDSVSFTIDPGETLGLVGESGCGKTTLGRTILRLLPRTSGHVLFDGIEIFSIADREMRSLRRRMQIVFQDPFSSLNPRMTVEAIVSEGIRIHGLARGRDLNSRIPPLLERVGLPADVLHRFPHEFSGGQRQRVGIARALGVEPDFIVCDEPVSALDVSVQAQVLNLLMDLKSDLGLSYLFISHDLSVVRHIADRVAVMYLGRIVETGKTGKIFDEPRHPYTKALISAIPSPEPGRKSGRIVLEGDVPSPIDPPAGCPFHPRCPEVLPECAHEEPPGREPEEGYFYQCFRE